MTSWDPWKSSEVRSDRVQAHWNRVVVEMGDDFYGAPSTQYYRRREIYLFQRYFGDLRGKKLLKLDLWNEVMNTKILTWAAAQGAKVFMTREREEYVSLADRGRKAVKAGADLFVSVHNNAVPDGSDPLGRRG